MAADPKKGILMPTECRTLKSRIRIAATIALMTICTAVQADNVADSDRILCSVSTIMLCVEDGECFPLSPLDLDVPQFMVIDLKKKTITTTEASIDNRVSKVANLVRENGRTFLQGLEFNRAYSILIEDDIGQLTASISRDGITVSVFGACTDANIQ